MQVFFSSVLTSIFSFSQKMIKQVISLLAALAAFTSCLEAQTISSCKPLTARELELKLESFGGYNKRYQAVSTMDARKFPRLLSQPMGVKASAYNIFKKLSRGKGRASFFRQTNLTNVAWRGSLDQNGRHHLCTEWSAVTTLPADHFPRYLNEVICDTVDIGCLSYEGLCVQESFVVDAMKKTGECGDDGKEIWEVVSQPIRSCCSCRLFTGSFLSSYL